MKNNHVLKITFLISLLLHVLCGILLYYFFDKHKTTQHEEEKKVKLAFKRGGDSMAENSVIKENTSISQQKLLELVRDTAQASPPSPNPSSQPQTIQSNPKPTNAPIADKGIDLASLQLYESTPNITPQSNKTQNINSANLSQMLQNLPQEQREEILDLYGDELGDYGDAEKDFIINNLRDIGRITQYYLNLRGYPPDAGYLRQQGKNAVEFYLHPNGDISDLQIIMESKSMILDKNTLKTIQIAYKDYPRPTTKTKIKIYVKYYIYN